jgi:hypothetical protein
MLSDKTRIADAMNHTTFRAGDAVILAEGPHKYVRGTFLNLKPDVNWAAVKEPNGVVNSHPLKWMRRDPETGASNLVEKRTQKE